MCWSVVVDPEKHSKNNLNSRWRKKYTSKSLYFSGFPTVPTEHFEIFSNLIRKIKHNWTRSKCKKIHLPSRNSKLSRISSFLRFLAIYLLKSNIFELKQNPTEFNWSIVQSKQFNFQMLLIFSKISIFLDFYQFNS